MALDLLSPELLLCISAFLDIPSLCQFSLVNHNCRSAARPSLFRVLTIKFSSPETLRASIRRWSSILKESGSSRMVQRLRLIPRYSWPFAPSNGFHFQDTVWYPEEVWKYVSSIDLRRSTLLLQGAAEWKVLTRLITTLPALREITWACEEQIPPCILGYMHKHLRHCRLHMPNFRLKSLLRPPSDPISVSRHEQEIATSPCLYSLAMKYEHTSENQVDRNEQAIQDMVAGAAPNLRKISILHHLSRDRPVQLAAAQMPQTRWDRQFISQAPVSMGSLDHLDLYELNLGEALRTWNERTAFVTLRSLRLHDSLLLDDLRWLTKHCSFDNLESLAMNPSGSGHDRGIQLANATEAFILSLPRLKSFKMIGQYTQCTLDLILEHCGDRLQHLCLGLDDYQTPADPGPDSPAFANIHTIQKLREKCPLLEELMIGMLRSQGDAHEVAMYKGFGGLQHLRKLHLYIHTSQSVTWNSNNLHQDPLLHSDGEEGQPQYLHVDSALIDLAIDKGLARSIFEVVSSSRALSARPLDCLELLVGQRQEVGGAEGLLNIGMLIEYIGRSWVCTRNPRDDRSNDCFIDAWDSEDLSAKEDWFAGPESLGPEVLEGPLATIIGRIWPESQDGEFKDVWHSFPLAT